MRTIEISEELWHYMEKYGNFGQPADSVLREALGITGDKPFPVASCRVKPIRTGYATNRLECRVYVGVLDLTFASGDNRRFILPNRDNKEGIRVVLNEAQEWAQEHDASEGQLNAIRKALTDNDYHLIRG